MSNKIEFQLFGLNNKCSIILNENTTCLSVNEVKRKVIKMLKLKFKAHNLTVWNRVTGKGDYSSNYFHYV